MAKRGWVEERPGVTGMSYRARYWAPNAAGELIPKSRSFSERVYGGKRQAKDAAEAHLAKMLTEVRGGSYLAPSRLTVRELTEQWLADHAPTISGNTIHNYRTALKHLRPSFGSLPVQAAKPMHLQALYRELRADGVGEGIMRQLHIVLSAALEQAVSWELISRNIAKQVAKPSPKTPEIAYWSDAQKAHFIACEGDHERYGAMWRLLVFTGMRVGELQALRWDDIDLTAGTLRIARTATRDEHAQPIIGTTTKTKNSRRTIPLPAPCVPALQAHRIRQRERQLAAPEWSTAFGDLVFTQGNGTFIRQSAISDAFRRATERAGLPPIKIHGLRHSAITSMLLAGVSPKVVAELVGDSVMIVLKVYSHVTPAAKQDAIGDHARRIAELIEQTEGAAASTTT